MSALPPRAPAAVVIDIEGTVGSIRFVKDVLFPFARTRLASFVRTHHARPDVQQQLAAVAAETGAAGLDDVIGELERWSDADRKATPLKALQGMIWAGGYASGELVAHLYEDAIAALRRWSAARLPVHVYSSGSVAAQKLYFAHTAVGDLTAALSGFFDTTTGTKQAADSYRRIADAVGLPAAELLFLSDVAAELEAARMAGLQAVQVRREPVPDPPFDPFVRSLAELPF